MKNKQIIITVVIALVVGAAGFFAGMHYQKSSFGFAQDRQFVRGNGNMMYGQTRQFGQGGEQAGNRMMGMRPVMGEIISSDDTSITVKLEDGSSKIVLVSDKTSIDKSSEASLSDLKTGEKVAAFGTENSDGSVTAQNIQLNPQLRMMQFKATGTPKQSN